MRLKRASLSTSSCTQLTLHTDGTGRSNLREELDTGIDVVLTTYGTLASEYKNWAGEDGEKPKKAQAKAGLYSGALTLPRCGR